MYHIIIHVIHVTIRCKCSHNLMFHLFVADNCSVSTISGNVNHNRNKGKITLKFKADDSNAKYTCKLDKESYKSCKLALLLSVYY